SYNRIQVLRQQGYKIAVYMPTFRESRRDALSDGALDLTRLAAFGAQNKIAFVLKSHFNTSGADILSAKNLVLYDNAKDIYPALPLADLLITDYSSVFFDFLLLDKPIVFFPYDYEKYVREDRGMVYEYDTLIPGPKGITQQEMEHAIVEVFRDGLDRYADKRREVRALFWAYEDGRSCERLSQLIAECMQRGG
ncbi:MAG: CDP-glycerol glycerophosphotransferase family protein, partial [FCB group bacterium]|nr:CDP-glycerol glycerophosphotransferase family protein [FCB group bacterium]